MINWELVSNWKMDKEEDLCYNDLMQTVQQKFLKHREDTSDKFHRIEAMIEVAMEKMSLISRNKQLLRGEEFVNPFGSKGGLKEKEKQKVQIPKGTLPHLKLSFPKFEEGTGAQVGRGL